MKVLCIIHGYPPYHNAGAEWMLHAMNKFLVDHGHHVRVLVRGGDSATIKNGKKHHIKTEEEYLIDGVQVKALAPGVLREGLQWCDVAVTHLDMTGKAINATKHYQVPLVHILHNTHHNYAIEVINPRNQYVVYNAEWNKKENRYKNEGMVLNPPVFFEDYKTIRRNAQNITLVNCWEPKGGNVLVELAKQMPDEKFLGVMGGYGNQVIGRSKNLRYEENSPEITKVYGKTKIILMPSSYESWGRVGVEAMCSGIPVIAHPTPGLKESLDYAGLFAHRDRIGEWIKIIEDLQDKEYYEKISALCVNRAKELSARSKKQMKEYEAFLEKIKNKGYEI